MNLKEAVLKNTKIVYLIIMLLGVSVLSAFSYMTYIFYQSVQGTAYLSWTYLVASPTLFALILILTLLFVGEEQTANEIADFLSRN